MIDSLDLACPILRAPVFEAMMTAAGHFGRGGIASAAVLTLLGYGYLCKDERWKKAGVALVVAIVISAAATELVRAMVQLPRPRLNSSYGFPSGHTSAAFSMAGVLATAFPQGGSLFYPLASFTGISRLYFRAHYLIDVFGGAVIGLIIGIPLARKLVLRTVEYTSLWPRFLGAMATLAVVSGASMFFYASETRISDHLIDTDQPPPSTKMVATIDLGKPQFRSLLAYGWSGDEIWEEGKRSVVWATGIASLMKVDLPMVQDYYFRVNVSPYAPTGAACQRIEVKMNNHAVAKLSLERGWHWYGFAVPQSTVRVGPNEVEFVYDYAESPGTRGRNGDTRRLSAAFDSIDIIAADASDPR